MTTKQPPSQPVHTRSIENLFDRYASARTKKELSNSVFETTKEVDGKEYKVQYLTRTVQYRADKRFKTRWAKEVLGVVDWLVEKDLIFHGKLAPFMRMELLSFALDKSRDDIWCDRDGKVKDGQFQFTGEVLPKNEYERREMLLIYPLAKVSREYMNNALDNEYFTLEGAIGNDWKNWCAPNDLTHKFND